MPRGMYGNHIRSADLAFDLITLRGEMRFDRRVKISFFDGGSFGDERLL